ncbi:flagellin [Succinivibrio dextrinosolvens]|uniref:Flagellin n=1 Tax=Succinivibrio dextrinosolvens TaxID=83771 RepID=A0A662ZD77_9GAMM|nr:flagellin [Succinivibrio dextrinosolvens]SFK54319.1 flagellin [Succinivibrio dextrinosolvens]
MASYVNTNVSSLNAQKNLTNATNALNTTYKRLSSGLRINSAKDDAAGLQISDRLTAHINGYNQGNRNANDGIALAQTAEGAMDEITNMMQRIRTLSVQASTGTLTTDDRKSISTEVKELQAEITRIACQSTFSGKKILRGTKDPTNSINASKTVDVHVGSLSGHVISMSFSQDLTASGAGMGIGSTTLKVSVATAAEDAIGLIDCALKTVDTARAKLGAYQNRLESTIRNQSSISENLSDARSRIRDTDYAEEAANLSQQSIIQQAATSMLTQANARPQIALSLLG